MLGLSREWVIVKFLIVAEQDMTYWLTHEEFPLNFARGVFGAGVIIPGLDANTRVASSLFTASKLVVTSAAQLAQAEVTNDALFTTLSDASGVLNSLMLVEGLHRTGAYMPTGLVSTVEKSFLPIDCTGLHGGSRQNDVCGVCGGDGTLCLDCEGVPFGPKIADHCGNCDTDPNNDCRLDCAGVWGGDSELNPCGVCDGDISLCFPWGCDGVIGSGLTLDACGMCGGNGTECLDCAGVPYGQNELDGCGICDADEDNDCPQDCRGTWGGDSTLDACGVCNGDGVSCLVSTHSFDVQANVTGALNHEELTYAALTAVAR